MNSRNGGAILIAARESGEICVTIVTASSWCKKVLQT
jgi:hypothetical protein